MSLEPTARTRDVRPNCRGKTIMIVVDADQGLINCEAIFRAVTSILLTNFTRRMANGFPDEPISQLCYAHWFDKKLCERCEDATNVRMHF